ncbi:ribosome biogenesis GTPase YlqF [[Mycoplasma] falconis]|nr:ribosome biogenesis GTPase YlqF [[Mycoplasma] falconis]
MAKQFKLLKEKQKLFDLFIIILDSRIPLSSFNSEIYKIANQKNILFIFNKSDKTDMSRLEKFVDLYKDKGHTIITNLKSNKAYNKINQALNKAFLDLKKKNEAKGKLTPSLKCVVLGVPNVGKSTFINLMAKSKVAKVGSIAGITRSEQWIKCKNYLLLDTPGLLMPKIENDLVGAKLAIVGSVRQEAINQNELIQEIYKLVSTYYPERLISLGLQPAFEEIDILNNIQKYATDRNLLLKNNVYDTNKAINQLISYFKNMDNVIYDHLEVENA